MTDITIPDIERVNEPDGERVIRFDNGAAIRIGWRQGQLTIGYCWPEDDEPFTTEFAIGADVDEVTDEIVRQWRICETTSDYALMFPEIDVLTGSQRSIGEL